jgi:hypothetical protein
MALGQHSLAEQVPAPKQPERGHSKNTKCLGLFVARAELSHFGSSSIRDMFLRPSTVTRLVKGQEMGLAPFRRAMSYRTQEGNWSVSGYGPKRCQLNWMAGWRTGSSRTALEE